MSQDLVLLQEEFYKLNPEQKKAALHKDGPLLVLAGAGSGKTKVVAVRIGCLISNGIPPQAILGLTFTNKAAQEMKERVQKLVKRDVLVSTFHSLGARILRETAHYLGFTPQFTIYDEEDIEKLLRTIAKESFGIEYKLDMKEIRKIISSLKNGLYLPDSTNIPREMAAQPDYLKIYALYVQKLKECNAVDFDDLLFLPTILFRNFSEVLALYQERWSYVLVDEYQDTNSVQYEFVQRLVAKTSNLFVVGDPDQSIYSWRGANIKNILNFEKDYPGATIVRLEQNYRSTKTILSAANAVIKNNDIRYEKSLWSAGEEGEKIQVLQAHSERDEAEFVSKTIQKLRNNHNVSLNNIVIFYRTNFQSRVFEDELIQKKLPYKIIGGLSFYLRKEIKDVLSFLRLLEHPNDVIAFMRVVNVPKRGFGEQFLNKTIAAARECQMPLMQFFCQIAQNNAFSTLPFSVSAKQKEGWMDFVTIMSQLHEMKQNQPLSELVRAAIFQTKYLEVVDADLETKQEKRENLGELIAKAEEWQKEQTDPSLTKFLEEISLVSATDTLNQDEERICLMTVHNGKGLEFETVFLVGIEEELFPHINSKKSEENVEEERRLFYVGITRAKKQLFLTHTSFRNLWGSVRQMRASRFLREIPEMYRERISHFSNRFLDSRPKPEPIAKPFVEYSIGQVIFHPEFGVGRIDNISEASQGQTLSIFFLKDDTTRKLVSHLAPITNLTNN